MTTRSMTIVSSRAFSGTTLHWIAFGDGALLAGLGLIGLCVHERLVERAVAVGGRPVHDGSVTTLPDRPAAGARALSS